MPIRQRDESPAPPAHDISAPEIESSSDITAAPAGPPSSSATAALLKEMMQIVLPAVVLALTIHIFFAQATVVYGQSMQPNLQPAERLVIEKISYYMRSPMRNDIVVLDLPHMNDLLIKRVVGLPGETVEIRRGVLYIDGQPQNQPYARMTSGTTFGPITLAPMTYFVMGDNRSNSNDSRSFGPVRRVDITGRAWLRYWPLNRFTLFGK